MTKNAQFTPKLRSFNKKTDFRNIITVKVMSITKFEISFLFSSKICFLEKPDDDVMM